MLDQESYGPAAADPVFLTKPGREIARDGKGQVTVEFLPYAIACLTGVAR
jgi:hypothetical protein